MLVIPRTKSPMVDRSHQTEIDDIKKEKTKEFLNKCIENSEDVINFYYNNNLLIDVHCDHDAPFRNACMANNSILAKIIYEQGNVDINTCNHQAFNTTCLNHNIEMANWFKSIDDKYFFTVTSDNKIDLNSFGYKTESKKESEYKPYFDVDINDIVYDNDNDYNYNYNEYSDTDYSECADLDYTEYNNDIDAAIDSIDVIDYEHNSTDVKNNS